MGLESGTFTDDLVVTNPPGSDSKSQGDDHLRLIKNCIRNTFKRATKAFSLPGVVSKNANYTVLATDENLTFDCDTTTAFTLTLPATAGLNAGWAIYVVKRSTDANPVFIQPASGFINNYAKVRRSREFHITKVLWTGNVWCASRPHGLEPGTSIPYHGGTLPNGYLWADGSTFVAADYVELSGVLGSNVKPDLRGRAAFGKDNMGVGAAGRIVGSSGIAGTTLGGSGGAEMHTLTTAQLALHAHSGTTNNQSVDHTHSGTTNSQNADHTHHMDFNSQGQSADHTHNYTQSNSTNITVQGGTPSGVNSGVTTQATSGASNDHVHEVVGDTGGVSANHQHTFSTGGVSASHNHTYTTDNGIGVSGSAHNNMPPTLICNYIMVAE